MALAVPHSELDPSVNGLRFDTDLTLTHGRGPQELQAESPNSFKGVIALPDESWQLKLRKPIADLLKIHDENSPSADRFTATRTALLTTTEEQADYANPLILSEKDINSVHNCAGRDVTIEASNRKVFLAGICRSVTVVGSDDNVMIEISNRGKLTVLGERNVVLWSSNPEGPEPMVIRGDGSSMEIQLPSQPGIALPLVTIEATRLASVPTTP
jgi:hypothetical protein